MKWARAKQADGTIITGVVTGAHLEPRAALGSDDAIGATVPLADLTLLAPVVPGKFIGLWNNFHAAAERNGWTPPEHPLYFFKADTSITGPDTEVAIPTGVGLRYKVECTFKSTHLNLHVKLVVVPGLVFLYV